ncbi:hypothetical protein ABC502_10030 [Alkalimonas sp. NCh-2]|uniref:hypothetical protein n=1 Tax=Alkalimonas sp. NCh-2 TaxID=3144846 RepID=UPI0031F6C182
MHQLENNHMKLPIEYRWLKAHGFKGFLPWWFIEDLGQEGLRIEYQKETGEDFYPFARRQDCDDVAGFKLVNGEIQKEVVSVHLTWAGKREVEGFPAKAEYSDIFAWLAQEVLPETADWVTEEDLADLEEENT